MNNIFKCGARELLTSTMLSRAHALRAHKNLRFIFMKLKSGY